MMKRIIVLITIMAMISGLTACSKLSSAAVTALPAAAASATPTALPTLTAAQATPAPAETALRTPTAEPTPKTAYAGLTIIDVRSGYGGYSDGKWLTENEAMAYCKEGMTFSEYNLVEFKGTVESAYDENNRFRLNRPKRVSTDYDYAKDPLCYSYFYYGGELPEIEIVPDTSEARSVVQDLLDEKTGEGKAKAKIRIAVVSDIDNDGEKETVINADQVEWDSVSRDISGEDDAEYCLSCIIESDGSVMVIDEYYCVPTDEDAYIRTEFFYVQNIIDLDGDGVSELVVDWQSGEQAATYVYKYDGSNVDKLIEYYVDYDEGS